MLASPKNLYSLIRKVTIDWSIFVLRLKMMKFFYNVPFYKDLFASFFIRRKLSQTKQLLKFASVKWTTTWSYVWINWSLTHGVPHQNIHIEHSLFRYVYLIDEINCVLHYFIFNFDQNYLKFEQAQFNFEQKKLIFLQKNILLLPI